MSLNGRYVYKGEIKAAEKYVILRRFARSSGKGYEITRHARTLSRAIPAGAGVGDDSALEILYEIGRLLKRKGYPQGE